MTDPSLGGILESYPGQYGDLSGVSPSEKWYNSATGEVEPISTSPAFKSWETDRLLGRQYNEILDDLVSKTGKTRQELLNEQAKAENPNINLGPDRPSDPTAEGYDNRPMTDAERRMHEDYFNRHNQNEPETPGRQSTASSATQLTGDALNDAASMMMNKQSAAVLTSIAAAGTAGAAIFNATKRDAPAPDQSITPETPVLKPDMGKPPPVTNEDGVFPPLADPISDVFRDPFYRMNLENRFSFVAPLVEAKRKKKGKGKKAAAVRSTGGPRQQTVNIPAAMGASVTRGGSSSFPKFAASNGKCLVQNFELVRAFKAQNATGNATFAALSDSLSCNPGIATSFPWCSAIALSYSKFRFKFLRYMYIPSVPTSIPGTCYIYTAYDPADGQPASLSDVMTADGSTCGPVWMGGGLNTEKAFRNNMSIADAVFVDIDLRQLTQPFYYVRKQAGVTNEDRPLVLYWGSDNTSFAGATTFNLSPGNLYVAYIIEFFDPVLASLNS
jgi:hypothetical protein